MKICINGIPATPNELRELERKLRLGTMKAFGRICRGFIYIRTEVIK